MERIEIVKQHITRLLAEKKPVIVAIDGKCTAGKTTLAAQLAELFDCNVFHMDDFFLRPHQRTDARLAKAGGNVDYERFQEEVLLPLQAGDVFSYRPFDCKSLSLSQPVAVSPKQLTVVEGSYSMHPYFGDIYDLKILLTVDPEVQRQRILNRPQHLHQRFFTQWIPMENRYLTEFSISDQADLVL